MFYNKYRDIDAGARTQPGIRDVGEHLHNRSAR